MADIARLAGVSISTVSRALNGSELINLETRNRIGELARSLNYSINVGAKNLRLGENRTIGVVIPYHPANRQHVSDPFFLGMLGSLADAFTDRGYDLLLSRVNSEQLTDLAGLYDSGRVRGIVVIGQWGHHDQLNALAARHVPFVVWGAQLPRQLYCSVGSDNVAGGLSATAHLLSLGRRRIAFLGDTALPEVAHRYEGYLQAYQAGGLAMPDDRLKCDVPFTAAEARAAMLTYLDRGARIDAVFAASDLIAMTAITVLKERGIAVPQDVSVVGYDDVEAASHAHPPLTTVRQAMEQAGTALAESLLALLRGEVAEPRILPTRLVVRESSVAA
jgi:DNA-binding LacI/PurR family transcriptional regulator